MKIEIKDLIKIFTLGFAGLIYLDYIYNQYQFNIGYISYGGFLETGQKIYISLISWLLMLLPLVILYLKRSKYI